MSTLPEVRPPSLAELKRFDLRHGLLTALGVLRAELGLLTAMGAVLHQLRRTLGRDVLRDLDPKHWPAAQEPLVRHQLRAAVLLDDVLKHDLGWPEQRRLPVLKRVIAKTGARFIGSNVPFADIQGWEQAPQARRLAFGEALTQRFFNAQVTDLAAGPRHFSFDVVRCRFVELCAALGRPYLAPLFCEADSEFFATTDSPIQLRRSGTLAQGASRCDFRFRYRSPDPKS